MRRLLAGCDPVRRLRGGLRQPDAVPVCGRPAREEAGPGGVVGLGDRHGGDGVRHRLPAAVGLQRCQDLRRGVVSRLPAGCGLPVADGLAGLVEAVIAGKPAGVGREAVRRAVGDSADGIGIRVEVVG